MGMNNDELWELQQLRWAQLKQGLLELKTFVDDLHLGYAASNLWHKLEFVKKRSEELQDICVAITRTAWKED